MTAAEESTAFPGVSRPVHLGGLGFTYKWNMGWMHDILAVHAARIRSTAAGTTTWSRSRCSTRYTENFILPFSHDEVVHGKRRDARQDAGRRLAEVRDAARALRLHVRASRARSCCSWAASSAQWREWNHDRSLDWHLLDDPAHAGLRRFVQDLNRLYQARAGAARGGLRPGRLPLDRLQRQREQRRLARALRAAIARDCRRDGLQLHAGAAAGLPHRRARRRASTPSCSTATRRSTAAATSATAAASPPSRSRRTASSSRCA